MHDVGACVLTHAAQCALCLLGADRRQASIKSAIPKKETELIPCGLRLCNEMHKSKDSFLHFAQKSVH